MRKDEKLKTIYETIAPHITRNESSWRDYLRFASTLYKYSFDNTLLIFAQNPNVTMLAPTAIWNRVGRYVNKGSMSLAKLFKGKSFDITTLINVTRCLTLM